MHEDLVPPEDFDGLDIEEIRAILTEDDVIEGLKDLGHEVYQLGLYDELSPLRKALREIKPHLVFNLLEEFHGQVVFDYHVVAYLELERQPYTGCNSRGLLLARDKGLSKKILHYHRIRAPRFAVFPRGRKRQKLPKHLRYPLIVKSLTEEASSGISSASVVYDDDSLRRQVARLHAEVGSDAIAEEYVDGRELYAAVMGNHRHQMFPLWELDLRGLPDGEPRIASSDVKWDADYQEQHKIRIHRARGLSAELEEQIRKNTRRICKALGLDGYVRIDYRLDRDGRLYFLEANPNPDIADGQEFASAARAAGLGYHEMLQKIVSLGIRRGA
ncbi:MAG: hypothetical protein KC731_10070 [Myxococcales bacterium]|nr:hypothetical protein [Myxococcales bacterium]